MARGFPAVQPLSVATRAFAAKPKVEDLSLPGRYATALFMASENIDKVYGDLSSLRDMIADSADLKLIVETPGIDPVAKVNAFTAVCKAAGTDTTVLNLLKVLVENGRIDLLPKTIASYEVFYRAEKGLVPCTVTSAAALSKKEMKSV